MLRFDLCKIASNVYEHCTHVANITHCPLHAHVFSNVKQSCLFSFITPNLYYTAICKCIYTIITYNPEIG